MRHIQHFLLCVCLTVTSLAGIAQSGTIRGKVTSGTTGEVLLGATVRLLEGTVMKGGAYTDLEGNYSIKAAPGTYNLIIAYISFVNDTLENVTVTDGGVVFNESLLFEEMAAREDIAVEISTTRNNASTYTLYNKKRNSINAIDGVSFDLVQRTGDANAAAAVTRIVGVTVSEGKYVYVRGLGDRYSKTTVNGAELPSLDPNQNAVQMDIFPANLIDNIIVYKNFTPDLPGSFTGGLVDVRTKDFPDRFTLNFSAATSFNPQANLRDDLLTSPEKGKTDWLGVDDGSRAVPEYVQQLGGIPVIGSNTDSLRNVTIDQATKSFTTSLVPVNGTSGLDQNYQLSLGNQHPVGKGVFGYVASLSYRSEFTAYQDGFIGRYFNGSNAATGQINPNLSPYLTLDAQFGQQEVLLGTLAKVSYKLKNHKFSFNTMYNQSGSNASRFATGNFPSQGADTYLEARSISFTERTLNINQLQGDHAIGDKTRINWIHSLSFSSQSEPDLRIFSDDYVELRDPDGTITDSVYAIRQSAYPRPTHFYRDLNEFNYDGRLNVERDFKQWAGLAGKIRFGGVYTLKRREFRESQYQLFTQTNARPFNGDLEDFFSESNLGIVRIDEAGGTKRYRLGNVYQQFDLKRNQYDADQAVAAAYVMSELPITARLKTVFGVRFETTRATIVSQDSTVEIGELDENDFLPALSFIFAARDNMNFRIGYARTLARPTFREFAPFESFDFAGDFTLVGNPNLKRTLIDNADVRWEWFFTPGELISVSAFYKYFANPIERVYNVRSINPQFSFENISSANTYGIELEVKKNFGFINDKLSRLEFGGNASWIRSLINIDSAQYAQIVAIDPDRPDQRPMFGQSPYAANAELSYIDTDELGLQVSLSYNVFGPRITYVGGVSPDVYEQPRGLLNLSVSKKVGKHLTVRLRANNLLDPAFKMTYEYKGREYLFQNYTLGRSYSAGISLSL